MSIESQELKPTKENLIKTLANDTVERNATVRYFATLCDSINYGCSIAIDAKWGEGKTFFIKQAKLIFDSSNPFIDNGIEKTEKEQIANAINTDGFFVDNLRSQATVYYDAWKNDNDEDPIASLLYEISKSSRVEFPKNDDTTFLDKAVSIVDAFSGKNLKIALDILKGEDYLKSKDKSESIDHLIEDYFDTLLQERGERLLVFIDELDRCRPTYAVQLLERIKHYLSDDRITFVYVINGEQLQHTMRAFYGADFDTCRYLDRFFDYTLTLPPPNKERYLSHIGARRSMHTFDEVRNIVGKHYNFSLRELERYIRTTNIAAHDITHRNSGCGFSDDRGNDFGYMLIVPIIIGIRMVNLEQYYDFIDGKTPSLIPDILDGHNNTKRICALLLSDGESFEKNEGLKMVTVRDKLTEVYNAIFSREESQADTIIGHYAFNSQTKRRIIRVASMLSEYATYK